MENRLTNTKVDRATHKKVKSECAKKDIKLDVFYTRAAVIYLGVLTNGKSKLKTK
jgi:hypothetical protein